MVKISGINLATQNTAQQIISKQKTLQKPVIKLTGQTETRTQPTVPPKKTPSLGKIIVGIGAGVLAVGGAILAKKIQIQQVNKAYEAIETKFAKLEKDLPNITEKFRQIFLQDLTQKETQEILNRYKEIEKMGVIATKEDYAQAVFQEAKNNFGLNNIPSLSIVHFKQFKRNNIGIIGGTTTPDCRITINSDTSKKEMLNSIHHELRHAKQRICAYNLDPEEYVKLSQPKNMTIDKKYFIACLNNPKGQQNMTNAEIKMANLTLKGLSSYKSALNGLKQNVEQWVEKDAYAVGNVMGKILGY